MYKITFYGQKADSGKMGTVEMPNGKYVALPACTLKRRGFQFVGWAVKREGTVDMKHLQINRVKYKDKQKVKDLAKKGGKVKLYACWRGYGAEAACKWARKIAHDNSFNYGVGQRAHHNGCYFCGTNITGAKHAAKGSRWEKTYCCNPFAYAAYVHGANLWDECRNSNLNFSWWEGLRCDGKPVFKRIGRNVKYSELQPGDLVMHEKIHVRIYIGRNKKGEMQIAHARSAGWGPRSICVENVKGRIGIFYVAFRYVGRE